MQQRHPFFVPLLLLAHGCLSGCRSPEPLPAPPVAGTSSARASASRELASLREDARYQQAEKYFAAGQRLQAASLLSELLARPELTDIQNGFLQRQLVLCRRQPGEGQPGSAIAPSPAPTPAAPVPSPDCGPRALYIICQKLGVSASLKQLTGAAKVTEQGASLAGLARAAESVGLRAEGIQTNEAGLAELPTPAIAWVDGNHYLIVLQIQGGKAVIRDPNQEREQTLSLPELLRRSGGVMLILSAPRPEAGKVEK